MAAAPIARRAYVWSLWRMATISYRAGHHATSSRGWQNTLHGGIQATLADEIASWTVFRKLQTGGVTSKMEVRYLRPVHIDDGDIELRAHIVEQRRNLVRIAVTITNGRGELATEAECLYFTFPQERAHDEFMFREFRCEDEL